MKNILLLFLMITLLGCKEESISNESYLGLLGNANGYDYSYSKVDEVDGNKTLTSLNRKLIKNGDLEYEVEDLIVSREKILKAVNKFKGYISSDEESTSGYRKSNTFNIRVPSENFDDFIGDAIKGVTSFNQKSISITDVTEQYVDVETRLKNKKALESRYLEILKKAKNVKEILEVEKEIGALREDIESTEGRLNYLKNQVAFSTIRLTVYEKIEDTDSFGGSIADALRSGMDNLFLAIIFLANIWPFITLIVIFLIWFKFRNKRKKSNKEKNKK